MLQEAEIPNFFKKIFLYEARHLIILKVFFFIDEGVQILNIFLRPVLNKLSLLYVHAAVLHL